MKAILLNSAKAIIAAVTPILVSLIAELASEAEVIGVGLISSLAASAAVYLTPNKPLQ